MPYDSELPLQRTIHAIVRKYDGYFVASCLEVSAVTDGRTLDELACNLQEAVGLYLEGENPADFGLVANPGITLIYQMELNGVAAA